VSPARRRGPAAVLAQRLLAQGLTTGGASTAAQVARRLLALQGQDLTQVRWALGCRTRGATLARIDAAFESASVVRAWCLRGTLHAVCPEDLPWLLSVLAERNLARSARRLAELRITDADVEVAARVVEPALRGRTASRAALFAELAAAGQEVDGQRGVHLLFALGQRGLLCQRGDAFGRLGDCVTLRRSLSDNEALEALARRYLEGHGPASSADFAFWSGLPKAVATRAFELVGPMTWPEGDVPPALLLAGFDEYLLGYTDRSACLDPAFFERIVPGRNGVFRPMVVLDGRIEGSWRREVKGKTVTVAATLFRTATRAHRRALEAEAARYGEFLGCSAQLVLEA
jgi:hypothetical protein